MMAVLTALPVLGGGPVRVQANEKWSLATCGGGPSDPMLFTDRDRNGVPGIGDAVLFRRGHSNDINVFYGPNNYQEPLDFSRVSLYHVNGLEKRMTIVSVDPATGEMTVSGRAERILALYRDVYEKVADFLIIGGVVVDGCRIGYFGQTSVYTGRAVREVTVIGTAWDSYAIGFPGVQHHTGAIAIVFPGPGGTGVVLPPCSNSPRNEDPTTPGPDTPCSFI